MKITTSFFASKAPQQRRVSIAKWPPRGYRGHREIVLAPRNPKDPESNSHYRLYLEERFPEPEALREFLEMLCRKVPDPILLCFERNPAECHRRVFAAFVEEKIGIAIPEWRDDSGLLGLV